MVDFGSPETWGMKVDEFLEKKFIPIETKSLTSQTPTQQLFGIQRQNFSGAGLVRYSPEIIKAGNYVKNLLKQIKPYEGATKIGESTKKLDRTPEKNFMQGFLDFAQEKFQGNFSAAAKAIGENRNKIKAIFDRVRQSETGTRAGADVGMKKRTLTQGEDFIPFSETTTKINYDKNYLKNLAKDVEPGFYSSADLARIFKIGKPGGTAAQQKQQIDDLNELLKETGVKYKSYTGGISGQKTFDLKDAIKKINERYFDNKQVIGAGTSKKERVAAEKALDEKLYRNFLPSIRKTLRDVSKEEDIYSSYKMKSGQAIPDVGHPISIKETKKFPKLFEDSNVNKINTLTFQDPFINQSILKTSGYESSHNKLFKQLNNYVGKKLNYKDVMKIKEIKKEMNALHDDVVKKVSNLAKENSFYKGQENNIPRLDIKVPTVGESFKSKDIYVNMNKVNPAVKVGYIDEINPNARTLSDLTEEQKLQYRANIADQYKNTTANYYKQLGYSQEQIDELADAIDVGTFNKQAVVPQGFDTGGSATSTIKPKKNFLKTGGDKLLNFLKTGGDKLLKGIAYLESPLAAGYFSASSISDLKKDIEEGKQTDVTAADITLMPAFADWAAKELGLYTQKTGVMKRLKDLFLRGLLPINIAEKLLPVIAKGSVYSTPIIETAIQTYNAKQRLEEAKEKYGTDDMVSTAMGMAPRQYVEELASELPDIDRTGAMGGGIMRLGYADGPKDPRRRKFIQGAVGLVSLLPFGIGRLLRKEPVQQAITKAPEVAEQGWSWVKDNFWTVVDTVNRKAKTSAKFKGGETKTYKDMEVIDGPDTIRVRYKTDRGNSAETVYNKPTYEVDPETGTSVRIPGSFEEYQDVYRVTKDDYYRDFEEEIIDSVEDVKKIITKD